MTALSCQKRIIIENGGIRKILERTKEEQELVDRAKAILMERNQMTEEEAHRYLQKTSMDNGTSFTETAQMILGMLDS